MEEGHQSISIEHPMVALPNASPDPGAVVVMDGNASVTDAAVENSWRLDDIAGDTLLQDDLFLVLLLRFLIPQAQLPPRLHPSRLVARAVRARDTHTRRHSNRANAVGLGSLKNSLCQEVLVGRHSPRGFV